MASKTTLRCVLCASGNGPAFPQFLWVLLACKLLICVFSCVWPLHTAVIFCSRPRTFSASGGDSPRTDVSSHHRCGFGSWSVLQSDLLSEQLSERLSATLHLSAARYGPSAVSLRCHLVSFCLGYSLPCLIFLMLKCFYEEWMLNVSSTFLRFKCTCI